MMAKQPLEITVETYGFRRVMAMLKVVDPIVAEELHTKVGEAIGPILDKARAQINAQKLPMSNYKRWQRRGASGGDADLSFRPGVIANGFGLIDRFGKRAGNSNLGTFTLINRSAPGRVYELAGVNKKSNPDHNKFLATLERRTRKAPRALIDTWRDEKGLTKSYEAAKEAASIAERRLQEMTVYG